MSEGEGKRADKIGAYAEQGNVYIDTLIVEQAEERAKLEGIPQNVPLRGATKFVGRDDELEKIHEQLQRRDRVAISAIAGMGGIGKTELAIQYAVRYAQEFPGGICWLSAKETDLVGKIFSFVRLCLHQSIPSELENKPLTLDQQFELCLQDWKPHGAVLMVLDDVSETTDFQSLVQKLPSRFRVLLTTRVRQLDASFFEVSLDVLAPPKSLELLTELIGSDRIEQELEAARELCKSLGQLPLGLELVGRYLAKKPWLTIAEMRSQLHLKHEALEQRLTTYVMTAEQGVRATFELSWEELSDKAQKMGRFLSLFTADAIPWSLVQRVAKAFEWSTEEMDAARAALHNLFLLQKVDQTSFSLHPLIREFLAIKLHESDHKNYLRSVFIQTLVQVNLEIPDTLNFGQPDQFFPLLQLAGEISEEETQLLSDEALLGICRQMSNYYASRLIFDSALAWREKCLTLLHNGLGEKHPDYVTHLHELASLYMCGRHSTKAESLYLRIIKIQEQQLGEDHRDCADTRSQLASVYILEEQYTEAESVYLQTAMIRKRLVGENHLDYAKSLCELASLYELEGCYAKSEFFYRDALQIQRKQLSKDDPCYIETINKLVRLYDIPTFFSNFWEEPYFALQAVRVSASVLSWNHPRAHQKVIRLTRILAIHLICGLALLYFVWCFLQTPSQTAFLAVIILILQVWFLLQSRLLERQCQSLIKKLSTHKKKRL